MLLRDAIIHGLKKPCEHCFNSFTVYKKEWKTRKQYSSNIFKEMQNFYSRKSKHVTVKRWIAECPVCDKFWLASSNKKELLSMIKEMNKSAVLTSYNTPHGDTQK